MMGLGKLVHWVRSRYGHGLRVAYYRDVVRPRILTTRPVENLSDHRCEIHVLTSQQDWLNLIWALKSFYWASQRRYQLCIHDDGTLEPAAVQELERHFPAARLIRRHQADAEVLPLLEKFPRCKAFRETNRLSPKLLDFRHYLNCERMLLLDSDVLFFSEPTELLRRIEDPAYLNNSVNEDCATAYTVETAEIWRRLKLSLPERFNSGLGLIHRSSLRLDWQEELLDLPGMFSHSWLVEQTLFALCSARHGVELLPAGYRIRLSPGINGCPAKHYVGAIRHLMYGEGMAWLQKLRLLEMPSDDLSPQIPEILH